MTPRPRPLVALRGAARARGCAASCTLAGAVLASAVLASACAHVAPSPRLLQARALMATAEGSAAPRDAPAELAAARRAMRAADAAFEDEPGSYRERHLAYVAQRRAQVALAATEVARAQRATTLASTSLLEEQRRRERETQAEVRELVAINQDLARRLERADRHLAAPEGHGEAPGLTGGRGGGEERGETHADAALADLQSVAQVRQEERRTTITLPGSLLFASGADRLLPVAAGQLGQVAAALKEQSPDRWIVVEGHTDSRGGEEINEELSERRALAVRTYLVEQGVAADQVSAVGRGEAEPVASNDSVEGRATNRRVEIIVRQPD